MAQPIDTARLPIIDAKIPTDEELDALCDEAMSCTGEVLLTDETLDELSGGDPVCLQPKAPACRETAVSVG